MTAQRFFLHFCPKISSFFEFWIDTLTTQYQKVITHSKSWGINTSQRIKQNKPVTPAFLFAVFLWQAPNNRFNHIKEKQRSFNFAIMQACDETNIQQIKKGSRIIMQDDYS
jgi:hypothetical protein